MMSFPEPDPVVLAAFFIRRFVWLEVLALLALTRVIAGRGPPRWAAAAAHVLCRPGLATTFAPMLGLNQGWLYVKAAQTLAAGGGMWALLAPSALMLLSALLPLPRWRIVDLLHLLLLLAFLGLWWWIS